MACARARMIHVPNGLLSCEHLVELEEIVCSTSLLPVGSHVSAVA